MKGVYGSEGNESRCPNCGNSCGAKSYCESCKRQGCVECIGMEKPSGCNECGSGPVVYIK